jgi:hypothetical protein
LQIEVRQIIEDLEEELENKNNLENILEFTKKLIQIESTPLKVLTAASGWQSRLPFGVGGQR